MNQFRIESQNRRRMTRTLTVVTIGVAAAVSLNAGSVLAQAPKAPVTINVVDVAGNLALTQDAMQNFASKNPNLVAKINFTKAPSPELPVATPPNVNPTRKFFVYRSRKGSTLS